MCASYNTRLRVALPKLVGLAGRHDAAREYERGVSFLRNRRMAFGGQAGYTDKRINLINY